MDGLRIVQNPRAIIKDGFRPSRDVPMVPPQTKETFLLDWGEGQQDWFLASNNILHLLGKSGAGFMEEAEVLA